MPLTITEKLRALGRAPQPEPFGITAPARGRRSGGVPKSRYRDPTVVALIAG